MKQPRKHDPRPGPNAVMAYYGHVRAKETNRMHPNDDRHFVGKKTKAPMRTAEPRFLVTHTN